MSEASAPVSDMMGNLGMDSYILQMVQNASGRN